MLPYFAKSVDTTTFSNTPDSRAEAIEYAMRGCPQSGLTFLFGIRLDPERAGISPSTRGLGTRRLPFLDSHDVDPLNRLARAGRVRDVLAHKRVLEPRLDAIPGWTHLGQVVGSDLPELHDLACPHELLAPFKRRLRFGLRAELVLVAERLLYLGEQHDELLHGRGVQREPVVRPLPCPVVRVMMLEDASAKHERGEAWDG